MNEKLRTSPTRTKSSSHQDSIAKTRMNLSPYSEAQSPESLSSNKRSDNAERSAIEPRLRWLFETPEDLICPISYDIFRDPVINCVGQVYDRASITAFMRESRTDPITRLPLADTVLTPVFLLRSRAHEYCRTAACACVSEACNMDCRIPSQLLRRAVELIGSGAEEVSAEDIPVAGLSPACVRFVRAHPDGADDGTALRLLAEG
eukprot:CAMPEP_0177615200 /NCGR_PEP_ID=MMETSP0419_2-20121207/23268_1 /TAXON_ID=582737 /ORGANISM="Tetraselmis sp., Strain GSL018" /LENGTH=204 /DNA_ID=CAMNT_0019112721 /DNA_START=176 /DNA_END=786 /DNA_ORIENTATION=+